jgi:hypothetical protein
MTSVKMDETFAAALRDLLVAQVEGSAKPKRWSGRSRRWIAGVGSVVVLAAGGSGIAYATGVFSPAPGGDVDTSVAVPVTASGVGTQTVQLGAQPPGTEAIAMSFSCLTAGNFTFADGASVDCGSADVARTEAHPATYTMSVKPGQDSTTITATPGASWRLTATYVSVTHTNWGVNASGQTYGVTNQRGMPDLVAVIATNHRSGYVYASQLNGPTPKTPSQALALQKAGENARPRVLTVYEADGKTPVGKFVVGR